MAADSLHLLRQLEPIVRPAYADAQPGKGTVPLEQQPFGELLASASAGLIESGRPVTAHAQATGRLDPAQLSRLASAADRAEAAGARQALLLVDGRGFVLDVANRQITAELSADSPATMFHLDTAMYVAGDGDAGSVPLPPPGGVAPPAVARQLEAAANRPHESGGRLTTD